AQEACRSSVRRLEDRGLRVPRQRRSATQRGPARARRGVEGGVTLGHWGKDSRNAEKPCELKRFSVPQCCELFPNVPGATLGPNNVRKQGRIRDFPNVPMSIGDRAPAHARDRDQLSLAGLGPELDDGFRFTWWNARSGAAVWIEHRRRWRAGVM